MGDAFFYHLTRSPVDAALPPLLRRATQAGWRVEVRGRDPERLDWLDGRLWLGDAGEFLAHGRAGGPHDALQPVLLTERTRASEATACVMCVDQAPVEAPELERLSRICVLFDGADEAALEQARGQWRALTAAGVHAKYWAQGPGGWEMKRESAG